MVNTEKHSFKHGSVFPGKAEQLDERLGEQDSQHLKNITPALTSETQWLKLWPWH